MQHAFRAMTEMTKRERQAPSKAPAAVREAEPSKEGAVASVPPL